MAASIHATAIIETGAQLGAGVEVGAYAYVGAHVTLGDGTRLHHHASIEGNTVLGKSCEVFPYACIGGKTQDIKFAGGHPGLAPAELRDDPVTFGKPFVVRRHDAADGATVDRIADVETVDVRADPRHASTHVRVD